MFARALVNFLPVLGVMAAVNERVLNHCQNYSRLNARYTLELSDSVGEPIIFFVPGKLYKSEKFISEEYPVPFQPS